MFRYIAILAWIAAAACAADVEDREASSTAELQTALPEAEVEPTPTLVIPATNDLAVEVTEVAPPVREQDFPTADISSPTAALPTALPTSVPKEEQAMPPGTGLSISESIPGDIVSQLQTLVTENSDRFQFQSNSQDNTVAVGLGGSLPIAEWTYAAAAPFATTADGISADELAAGWQNGLNDLGQLIIDHQTAAVFTALWGPPSESIVTAAPEEIAAKLWAARPSWTILPVHKLTPDLKLLRIDGQSLLDPEGIADVWPLRVEFSAEGQELAKFASAWGPVRTNFDPSRLTRVAMSGVTALGRATAYQMEIQGVTAPGEAVGPVMSAADIAHVSHEVSFSADCPYPNPIGDPIFCARDKYLELLTTIGVDVVELTGNHLNDYGQENTARSVDFYEEAGMKTFGGGRNIAEAAEPALFEHNGNRIAFVGCNLVGPAYDWAGLQTAGSRPCDWPAFTRQIGELEAAGYLVIATIQYYEFYHYEATAQQRADFRAIAEAGASAVSGSQGHHVQGFDFHDGAFIHHGLGNLFFDQMDMLGTRQTFVDIYHIYNGRLINVDLYTGMIENYCCPRDMTLEERNQLLKMVFEASGW